MKHIIMAALLGLAIIVSQTAMSPQAYAQDVYVGTSNTTGRDCYLMTETIKSYRKSAHGMNYDATLKMVRRSDGNVQYLYYTFYEAPHPYFWNSQGYEGVADQYKTPIEWNMFWAIQDYL
ncbi:MAG: hypothetical protein IJ563_07935 [Selenomonadaceae bacterium]|nr:hypothetical protein [Selenomonadaceae bacterium]MBR1859263.1 hypothetical protein [Selenomonadaceae bacterium]